MEEYTVTYDPCRYRESEEGEYDDPASWTDDQGKIHYAKHALLVVNNALKEAEQQFINVDVKINWKDQENQDGIRPEYVELKLLDEDGNQAGNRVFLSEDVEWKGSFPELDKFKDGAEQQYFITSDSFGDIEGYTAEITGDMVNGFVITFVHNPKTIDVSGEKVWEDANDQSEVRPESVRVHLLANGESVEVKEVSEATGWTFTFKDQPEYQGGEKIVYTVEEEDVPYYTAAYTEEDGLLVITNTYQPDSVTQNDTTAFQVEKTVKGHDSIEAFAFELSAAEDYGDAVILPENKTAEITQTISKDSSAKVMFAPVTFIKAGTYQFKVREVTETTAPGWVYDNTEKTLTVKVIDEKGKLTINTDGSTLEAKIVNRFNPAALDGEAAIVGRKLLTGRDMLQGEKFEFRLEAADDATKAAVDSGEITIEDDTASLETLSDGEEATFTFGKMEFESVGTYTFKMTEKNGGKAGMTYDTEEKTFQVTVVNENGVLKATQESVPQFTNSYNAAGTFTPGGTKTLLSENGNKLDVKAGQFRFKVRYANSVGDAGVVSSGTTGSGKDAPINFDQITYQISGEGGLKQLVEAGYADVTKTAAATVYTLDYQVTEEATGNNALQQNTQVQAFRVTVTDNGSGTLQVASGDGNSLKFENAYKSDKASVSLDGLKVLEGRVLKADEFTFRISSDDKSAPMPEKTSVKNLANGEISFGKIQYGKDDLGDATEKTFVYQISESGQQPGVTNDTQVKTVKVTIADDGQGHITAALEPATALLFTFTNRYQATPGSSSVTDSVKVTKVLVGSKLKADAFRFVLKDEAGDVVARGTNDEDGRVTFPALTFDKTGTYNYTIEEEAGDSPYVEYDETKYSVTAVVTDSYDGKALSVAWNYGGGDTIEFRNVYTPKPVSVNPTVEKKITGDTPKEENTFYFTLKGVATAGQKAAWIPLPEGAKEEEKTVSIQGEGGADFGLITFTAEGTYTYQIAEKAGKDKGYTYDETVYELTYVVTDKDGVLTVEETLQAGGEAADKVVFTNLYKEPKSDDDKKDDGKKDDDKKEDPKGDDNTGKDNTGKGNTNKNNGGNTSSQKKSPVTGDDKAVKFAWLRLLVAAGMLTAAIGFWRKKKYR